MKNTCFRIGALVGILSISATNLVGQESVANVENQVGTANQPWTIDTAREELSLRPQDPYLQFVVAQLEHSQGKANRDAAANPAADQWREQRRQAAMRSRNVDLFSIFSGSLAVQESLQLDAMTNVGRIDHGTANVLTSSLSGPVVQSHPWKELLGGRDPPLSTVAYCVPADQLYVRFRSVSKLLQMQDLGEQYATYVTTQTKKRAYKANRIAEIQKQLALEVNSVLSPIYDAAVAELAITSSDLYFVDGNDITVIMQLRQPTLIRSQLDRMLANAAASNKRAVKLSGEYQGVPYEHISTPNGAVYAFSAYPKPNLHVRSNSLSALKRSISTILDKPFEGQRITSLGETDEFRYIRTLMPAGDDAEDGLVYLSDPFIRNVIGPEQKLTQRARLICKNQLQLITFASLLYQTQYGQRAVSIEQLEARGCLGSSAHSLDLACPSGGELTLAEDGMRGCCSHHGCFHSLNPVNEIVRRKVTEEEAREYQNFVEQYSRYWTTFFDPIAIRVQHGTKRTRIETIVLPLINNSVYQGMAFALGGEPESLVAPLVTRNTIFSVATRLNKQRLLGSIGIEPPASATTDAAETSSARETRLEIDKAHSALRQISLGMLNFESAYGHYPPKPSGGAVASAGKVASGMSWRVQILPFVQQTGLYNAFHHDEPWDSDHNRSLIEKMPDIFAAGGRKEDIRKGKTRIVRPYHSDALYSSNVQGARLASITDGTSNTLLAVLADVDQAVSWTKPEDIEVDIAKPGQGWADGLGDVLVVAFADGAVGDLPKELSDAELRALLTRTGGELIGADVRQRVRLTQSRRSRNPLTGIPGYEGLGLPEFLYKGIGNQVAIHVCDDDPLVDFSVARLLGMLGGSFNGRGNMFFGETGMFAVLAMSMNAPVYISIPVTDTRITDAFLDRFDRVLARANRENSAQSSSFIAVELDNYRFADSSGDGVRAFAFRFGPITWRFYWARIGDGVFIASKPGIIRDLKNVEAETSGEGELHNDAPEPSHGAVRVRPKNWHSVLPHYQIGWAESERLACLDNLGWLADLGRAGDAGSSKVALEQLARTIFHAQYICPCGGAYSRAGDGPDHQCSVHGSLRAPRQPSQTGVSAIGELTKSLSDAQLQIQFLEDGLHATVVIERE